LKKGSGSTLWWRRSGEHRPLQMLLVVRVLVLLVLVLLVLVLPLTLTQDG
jgi:hypothetical protein